MACCGKPHIERKYQPNYRSKPLTPKFYARHDTEIKAQENIPIYEKELNRRCKYDPRKEYIAPITTSQTYGWLEHYAIRYTDELDRPIFNRHHITDREIAILIKVNLNH